MFTFLFHLLIHTYISFNCSPFGKSILLKITLINLLNCLMASPLICELHKLQPFTWTPCSAAPPSSSNFFLLIAFLDDAYKKLNVHLQRDVAVVLVVGFFSPFGLTRFIYVYIFYILYDLLRSSPIPDILFFTSVLHYFCVMNFWGEVLS